MSLGHIVESIVYCYKYDRMYSVTKSSCLLVSSKIQFSIQGRNASISIWSIRELTLEISICLLNTGAHSLS